MYMQLQAASDHQLLQSHAHKHSRSFVITEYCLPRVLLNRLLGDLVALDLHMGTLKDIICLLTSTTGNTAKYILWKLEWLFHY